MRVKQTSRLTGAKRPRHAPLPSSDAWESQRDELEARLKVEMDELKSKHDALRDELESKIRAEHEQKKAAGEADFVSCGECGEMSKKGDFFLCNRCAEPSCNKHKGDMTTCVECESSYCSNCIKEMDVCAGCSLCPQLTCCNLERMPCGEMESGDCVYYHHKQCRCQK